MGEDPLRYHDHPVRDAFALQTMKKMLLLAVVMIGWTTLAPARTGNSEAERAIADLIQQLADAALASDTRVAEKLYDESLILTSQSGKVYSKNEALLDLKNAFEIYRNDDFKFRQLSSKAMLVNYQNTRKRRGSDEAKFRVTSVWMKRKDGWKLISLQASKIAAHGTSMNSSARAWATA